MTIPRNLSFLAEGASSTGILNPSNGGTGLSSLTAGYIPYGNGTGAFGSSVNLFWDASNNRLGVGLPTPSYTFHVTGSVSLTTGATATPVIVQSGGPNQGLLRFGSGGNPCTIFGGDDYGVMGFSIGSGQKMQIANSGGVSIGNTTDPGATNLSVTGKIGVGLSSFSIKLSVASETSSLPTLGTGSGGLFLSSNNGFYGLYGGVDGSTGNTWLQAMRNDSATAYNIILNPVGGNIGVGTGTPSASAILDAQSTTKGVRMPNMTTTQKNAISSPAAGLIVFDTTLAKLCVYTGSVWQTITSI